VEVSSALEIACISAQTPRQVSDFFAFSIIWKKKLARGEGEEKAKKTEEQWEAGNHQPTQR